ncbi:MAG: O-antigen ligase family protein [Candidatus Sulfotelmatobacter sp.]|jgi:putative inorganic carbon (hco3(-)) transporter
MISSASIKLAGPAERLSLVACQGIEFGMVPIRILTVLPVVLFFAALSAMLLRPPDVAFYEVDRIAFAVLLLSVAARTLLSSERLRLQRATWPMMGLTLIAVASVIGEPFDSENWSLLSAKFIVPFALFHVASLVFRNERNLRKFELFALVVLAYLCFTSIAFLVGANSLIFPRFILDETLGYHVDRARGPFLQAVANGVSLNLLGLLAIHAYLRGRMRGVKGAILLASLPIAILATMTRAIWLSFVVSVGFLIFRSGHRKLRRICIGVGMIGVLGLLMILGCGDERHALCDRLKESGPVDFREAVYSAGWEMFLEKPISGWGINQMPAELARHVSGYNERELYPHNTYLELLVEHGIFGLALYAWLMWELLRLGRGGVPPAEENTFLSRSFHAMWPVLIGVYLANAIVVVMNYQFVNGLLFTMAGMLAAQQNRTQRGDGA